MSPLIRLSDAVSKLVAPSPEGEQEITVIGTERITQTFDELCLQQAVNTRLAPGVIEVVLNPDAHAGYGAPVGSVMASPTHIYPGPVGVDIKCSMSLLQLDVPAEELRDPKVRRELIDAVLERIPTGAGAGQRSVKKSRHVSVSLGTKAAIHGASPEVCTALGIPAEWATKCEDAHHVGHDGTADALTLRLEQLSSHAVITKLQQKYEQLGSYGGGNHFGEANVVHIEDSSRAREVAGRFGLKEGCISFLSHCGSRGFGFQLAQNQFRALEEDFRQRGVSFPGADKQLVYAALGSSAANAYLDDMALGANFATINHLLINALVLEAFQQVLPGTHGDLIYFISHNIARPEMVNGQQAWVHRKGATRAFPADHEALRGTPFYDVGHPILLPGNPLAGSAVMVADPGAAISCFSVNHGAGRAMGRNAAKRALVQAEVDTAFNCADVLSNCRLYPLDEAPAAYKDFDEVLRSVKLAGLASEVARLKAVFVIKDQDRSLGGAA